MADLYVDGTAGTQNGLAIGATSCNAGNMVVNFLAMPDTNHPAIAQNLYRMSGGSGNDERFEQIGQAWAKHTFGAKQVNSCGFGCQPSGNSHHLGVGCSDTYTAFQSATQALLGSRAWINPFTGVFPSNAREHTGHTHSGVSHKMVVEGADLEPTLNPGATYYAELLYVTPDENAWCQTHPGECNMYNNASYRRYNVSGAPNFLFSPAGETVRMTAAVNAWTGATISPIEPEPGVDGRAFIAYKVTGPVAGVWHYEYAIYNENLDRAIQSFSVPLGCGVTVTNLGFHAPLNHPGFPNDGTLGDAGFSNTAWASTQDASAVIWNTETFAQNQNANAIRWGTLYNFRFDSNKPPIVTNATIGFFKTGTPVTASIFGPNVCAVLPPAGNGKIVFTAQRDGGYEIYVMDSDGANQTRLTNNPASDDSAAWSLDGTKIAFSSNRDDNFEIYLMNADGSNQTRVTNNSADDQSPHWSPDGTKIAFASNRDGNREIYVMNADGSNQTRLTVAPQDDYDPNWSPDGGQISFTSNRNDPEVFLMDADGSNQVNLTNNTSAIDSGSAWSPDGTKIAFSSTRDGGGIFVMNRDGTNVTRLTQFTGGPETDSGAAWAPDGTKVAYQHTLTLGGSPEIFVVNADGSNPTRLTNDPTLDREPDWQRVSLSAAQALNLSTRMLVQTGDNVGIGGFIVTGTVSKHVVIRAVGPSLVSVPNPLADPVLELHGPPGFPTIINDNCADTQIPAPPPFCQPGSLDAAIEAHLNPGAYSAIVRGKNNTSGVALAEVYDVDQGAASKLANISTRALVGTSDNIVIAGFILGGNSGNDQVLLRGIGPSFTAAGVPNALADPTLELRDSNGVLLLANNDWQDDPTMPVLPPGLQPTSPLESVIMATLPPGLYTALLAGVNNGTGIGLVEVYDLGAP
jgi:Tol biopolymer transport system component